MTEKAIEALSKKEPFFFSDRSGKVLTDCIHLLEKDSGLDINLLKDLAKSGSSACFYQTQAFFRYGFVGYASANPRKEENLPVLGRFAQVIEQTYTRFLDLKKAEAQARESQIEAALERVRSRALAMQTSRELEDVALVLRTQMGLLGQEDLEVCAFHLYEVAEDYFESWGAVKAPGEDGKIFQGQMRLPKKGLKIIEELFEWYESDQTEYMLVNEGEKGREFLHALKVHAPEAYQALSMKIKNTPPEDLRAYWSCAEFSGGSIIMVTYNPPEESSIQLLSRAAKVFDLAYRRFLDLQKAEKRAVEAARDASLDRVRAEIASMRSTEDLERITPLVWRELTTLEVPFFRCGVFIMDEEKNIVHTYLSTPDGQSLSVLHLPFDGAETTRKTVEHWRKQAVYLDHWDQQQFIVWVRSLTEESYIGEGKTYQGAEHPPERLALHFLPFKQGMLYVGHSEKLPEEQIALVQRLADTFAVAYARYEDFNKLEEAKRKVETTLTELKATQSQLIQSEKLASLGELTAGIAHEIQNPLNFVNNFAEMSVELAEELKEELEKEPMDAELVKELMEDLTSNQQKINRHGKRAASIVTGMLQHARASTGAKEPTDLNALADEYLRLAYHGLRAKDSKFNAKMETDFDPSIGKVEVIPQDIGRVFLNIINNAFYATQQRAGASDGVTSSHPVTSPYEPTVSVSSRVVIPPWGGQRGA